jgi:uncharacterized protein (DUF1684 family)
MLRLISGTIALSLLPLTLMADDTFETEALRWREAHEAKLKADDGWLTLVGLHWLEQGDSPVGSADGSAVHLPATAPAKLGVLKVAGDRVTFTGEPDVPVSKNGKPFRSGDVATDAGAKPDVLAVGTYKLTVIKRGEKLAVRVKDNASPARSEFKGLTWFAPDPSWKIRAKFLPSKGKSLALDTIVGTKQSIESPGMVEFEKDGQTYRLEAALEGDTLWFVFRDATSGKTTHPNARQLNTPMPDADGFVTLDFNRAVNLPCAYTPFATCPIAPLQNRLKLAITAGEKRY